MSESANRRLPRFSLKALLYLVVLIAVALTAFQLGYGIAQTKNVLELIDQGWIPPKPSQN